VEEEEEGRAKWIQSEEFLLTHHHQGDFPHVDPGPLLDLALVGAGVGHQHVGDGDGGVARLGVSGELEPLGEAGLGVVQQLATRVGQDLGSATTKKRKKAASSATAGGAGSSTIDQHGNTKAVKFIWNVSNSKQPW